MSDLNLQQLTNLSYTGTVVKVAFGTSKIQLFGGDEDGTFREKTPPESLKEFYTSSVENKKLFSFLCSHQVGVGDLVLVLASKDAAEYPKLRIAEVIEITTEEDLDLEYKNLFKYVISVIPQTDLATYWENVATQKATMEKIKTQKARQLRSSLKEALLAENLIDVQKLLEG